MKSKFKKGEYYVPLTDSSQTNNWNGWILKQRESANVITPEFCPNTGNTGSTSCSWNGFGSDKPNSWRPATNSEIEEYKKHNKPVRVKDVIEKPVDVKDGIGVIENSYYEIY